MGQGLISFICHMLCFAVVVAAAVHQGIRAEAVSCLQFFHGCFCGSQCVCVCTSCYCFNCALITRVLQLLALIAMECPVSNHPDDIRDEKCKVLRSIKPIGTDDVLLGQYVAGAAADHWDVQDSVSVTLPMLGQHVPVITPGYLAESAATIMHTSCWAWLSPLRSLRRPGSSKKQALLPAGNDQPGYLDDPTVPAGSKAPTYAACRLHIDNERWAGVPFILRAGKALNERSVVVRIQLHANPVPLFGLHGDHHHEMRNEFVMRLQPGMTSHNGCGLEGKLCQLVVCFGMSSI